MNTRMTANIVVGAMLMAATIASAQTPSADSAPAPTLTCQQTMDKATPLVAQIADATKMAEAQKHLSMAKSNMDAGRTVDCQSEMKQVMQLLN